jgi:uncharacterized membrane protein
LEAFSDGVFAIALTLLVLELKVPQLPTTVANATGPSAPGSGPSSQALAAALLRQWPSYFAFVTSFFSVLVMWMHHHAILRLVRRTDAGLLFSNGFLLLMVTFVPFPTAVVATYLRTPAAGAACLFYSGTFVVVAISFQWMLRSALCARLLPAGASLEAYGRLRRGYRFGPLFYLLATAAAPLSAWLSLGVCTALWIFWAATANDRCAE